MKKHIIKSKKDERFYYMFTKQWIKSVITNPTKKPMPVLSFPGSQLIGATVREIVLDGEMQAKCMKAIADRYQTIAAVSNMDLSVEAEAFGADTVYSDNEVPSIVGRLIVSKADVEQLNIPEVGAARTGEYVKAIGRALELITDRPVFAGVIGPFSLAGRLMDMTEIMYNVIDEPEMVHLLLDKVTEFLINYILAFKKTGAHGILMAEPAAGLLSPALNEEFSAQYVKQIVSAVQDDDFIVIYHNCGNSAGSLVPAIVETGAAALHFGSTVDLSDVIKQIPSDRLVMGNVDSVNKIAHGTPEQIKEAVRDMLEKMRGHSNYVLSSSCDIPPQTRIENVDAFFEGAGFNIN
jgi:uroporphyrinogen decarboxylase